MIRSLCLRAIENLYERCRAKSKIKSAPVRDIEGQLRVIQDFMMDLSFIVKGRDAARAGARAKVEVES
jgi:hypothetical protein